MDFKDTYAFLIGVQKYNDESFPPLPQALDNVTEMRILLRSDTVGLPSENITVTLDPANLTELEEELAGIVSKDSLKTLIIYYSGHGEITLNGDHYLTISTSTRKKIDLNGLSFSRLSKILEDARNKKIIFILDSCFSERAFENFESRNYLLIASSEMNKPSYYPPGARCSAFTGELITVFNEGVLNNSSTISWREVYEQLVGKLDEEGWPIPRISSRNEVDEAIAGKNNYKEIPLDDFILNKKWRDLIDHIAGYNADFKKEVLKAIEKGGPEMAKTLKFNLLSNLPLPIAHNLETICTRQIIPQNCFNFYEKSIQFLYFVFFMQLENFKSDVDIKCIADFIDFKSDFEKPPVQFITFDHLKKLCDDIINCKTNLFISEIDFNDQEFQRSALEIQNMRGSLNVDVEKLQDNMMTYIKRIGCLINYKLVSVKEIWLKYPKYKQKRFSHQVSLLEGVMPTEYDKVKDNIENAFINQEEAANSHSVLLIKRTAERSIDAINLWPLIIDASALSNDPTPKVYYYVGKDDNNIPLYEPVIKSAEEKRITITELDKQADIKPFMDLLGWTQKR
jgi:hypothetical protein